MRNLTVGLAGYLLGSYVGAVIGEEVASNCLVSRRSFLEVSAGPYCKNGHERMINITKAIRLSLIHI